MKQALSARYGGLLVDAHECDYLSFKHLHLLCPNCKKSVFLVGEKHIEPHTRKIKRDGEEKIVQVKGSEVSSYFAHHPDVSASAVEACELRVRSMSEGEKLAIKAQSRRQLVKVLHSHFWKILNSPTADDVVEHERNIKLIRSYWVKASVKNKYAAERLYELLIDNLERYLKQLRLSLTNENLNLWIDSHLDAIIESAAENISPGSHPKELMFAEFISGLTKHLDSSMHKAIVSEMLDFIFQPRQKPILRELIESNLWWWVTDQILEPMKLKSGDLYYRSRNALDGRIQCPAFGDVESLIIPKVRLLIGMDKEFFKELSMGISEEIYSRFCLVDWAGQYEKYHNEDLAKGKATV